MSKNIKSVLVLTIICAVVSLLLAGTYYITSPIIAQQENAKTNESLLVVYPDAGNFEQIDISKYELPESVTEAYKAENGGYAIKLNVTGYQPNMVILCGIDKDGVVTGAVCISSAETLGKEKTYGENFVGKTSNDYDSVDTVANATYTTLAYKNAIKDALNAATILGGGSADLRSEEEILNDNLNTALPDANGKFEEVYMVEKFEGLDAVYTALNKKGFVFKIGEEFFATDAEGNLLKATANSNAAAIISNASKKIITWESQKLDLATYTNLPTQVKMAYKTDESYIFVLHAEGFGIKGGESHGYPVKGNGIPIVIQVEADKNGKIISCVTISQSETEGYGKPCGDQAFYSQFDGKTENDYSSVDAISGATVTTTGYKAAIGSVFEAIKILEGVS